MAGSDKETRRVDSGRNTDQSPNSIGEAPSSKTKQQLKEQDAEWGFEPGKSGMATEAKMGMCIIAILVCAFGFLVYHKFDLRQRQLLAAQVKGQSGEQSDLQQAVAQQASGFDEFAGQVTQTTAKTETLQPAFDLQEPMTQEVAGFQKSAPPVVADVNSMNHAVGESDTEGDLFALLDEPQPNPMDVLLGPPEPEAASPLPDEDPFAALAAKLASKSPPQPPAFEPSVPPDRFADNNPTPNSTPSFPEFDDSQSVAVAAEPAAADDDDDVAVTNPFGQADVPADPFPANPFPVVQDSTPAPGSSPRNANRSAVSDDIAAFEPTAASVKELPFADEVGSGTTTKPVSQSSRLAGLSKVPGFDPEPDLFASPEQTKSLPPAALPEQPRFLEDVADATNNSASNAIRNFNSHGEQQSSRGSAFGEPRNDLHNVIAMLEPSADVNLFEDPIDRPAKPPQTFPADNDPRIPVVEEPEMPRLPGFDERSSQQPREPVLERFPAAQESQTPAVPFSGPNLFQEPIVAEPEFSTKSEQLPSIEFEPVPQPVDLRPANTRPLRPYEPQPMKTPPPRNPPTLTLGPEDGVAHLIPTGDVQQTSGAYEHKEICEVADNDTYWTISKRIYGTPRYFSSLALYNQHRIPDPRKLRPGMKVLVPDPKVLEAKYPEFFPVAAASVRSQPTGYFLTDDGKPAYRVGERETLGAISQKHLGRASRWIQIYQMNRQTLKDPNKLKPGTVINLPDDATNVGLSL